VVDATFEEMERAAKEDGIDWDTTDTLYLGVEIPPDFVCKQMIEVGFADPLAELFFAGND